MQWEDYPAIYKCADRAALRYQRIFLSLVVLEYTLLVTAAATVLHFTQPAFSLIFVALVAVVFVRFLMKPQQDWYACRALAESVKTMCWRYAMRADQNGIGANGNARARFREQLLNLLVVNRIIAEKVSDICTTDGDVPEELDRLRSLPLEDRRRIYLEQRVNDQRNWYHSKARQNRRRARLFTVAAVLVYVTAGTITLLRGDHNEWAMHATEPLIVLGASVLGWMELRNFESLAAAYSVTALEIGMISPRLNEVETEEEFAEFVTDAELAFSREHTLWVARNIGLSQPAVG